MWVRPEPEIICILATLMENHSYTHFNVTYWTQSIVQSHATVIKLQITFATKQKKNKYWHFLLTKILYFRYLMYLHKLDKNRIP